MDGEQKSGNLTGLYSAAEESLGVLPATPVWKEREPNSYGDFGGTFAMTTRKPITHDRQTRKGEVSDNNPTAGYNEDFTLTNMIDPFQSFLFADAREKASSKPLNGTERTITSVDADSFNAAAGLAAFQPGHIVLASGFSAPSNNGIHIVAAAASAALTVDGVLEIEAAPPAEARLDAVGYMFGAGDLSIAVDLDSVDLVTVAGDFRALNLVPGEYIGVGGDTALTRFSDAGNNAPFYGRVARISADGKRLTLDKTTGAQANDAGAGKEIQIFFGTVIKNEDDCERIKMRSYTFERQYGCGADQEAEYVGGAVANQLTLNIPTPGADAKVNVDLAYIATTSYERTAEEGILAGTRIGAANEPAYKPGINVYRNRIAVVDPVTLNPTALVAYNQQMSLVINNNLGGNKAIEAFGNSGINIGEFSVSGTATSYFNGVETTRRVREGAELTWDFILTKGNAAFAMDIASYGLGNAKANVAPNEPITVPLEGTAGKGQFGYTILTSFFRYVPTVLVANRTA
jgi:hypothetical protein